ncbi:hypothetical protein JTB14_003371 [Gonioctena quinquepunctata]|nr:hypothetical protein JTB14_003371 [Gonioctena quinquepunctata]
MQQHFWTRWSKEFISEMQIRTKWKINQLSLEVGDLVVIKDDHTSPTSLAAWTNNLLIPWARRNYKGLQVSELHLYSEAIIFKNLSTSS